MDMKSKSALKPKINQYTTDKSTVTVHMRLVYC